MRMSRFGSLTSLIVLGAAAAASAQTPVEPRILVGVGFGQQSASAGFSAARTSTVYAEQAQFNERYGGRVSATFAVSGALHLWQQVWVEAAYGASSYRASVDVRGDVPHPFRFNTLRAIEGEKAGLERKESDVHVALVYRVNVVDRLVVSLSVGPTVIHATQDVVDSVTYDETYPYDAARFTGAVLSSDSTSKATLGIGVDISYRVRSRLSVGVVARHARATGQFESASGHVVRAKIGGTDVTGGVRVGF